MKQLLIIFLLFFTANTSVIAEEDLDPFEDINRVVYEFNEVIDNNLFKRFSAYKTNAFALAN